MYYHHDSCNKLKHKLTIYRHFENTYSDEKEPKRREKESGKEMRRDRDLKKRKENFKKMKSMNELKINKIKIKKEIKKEKN